MAVTASNLIMGAGTLYGAPSPAVDPSPGTWTAPTTPWADLGGTSDGVTISFNQEYTPIAVDQLTETVERRRTSSEFTLATNLAEATLENLAIVLNQLSSTVVAAGTGATSHKVLEPVQGPSSMTPGYTALIFEGQGANQKKRRVIGRKMLSTDNTSAAYSKDGQTVFSVTWTGHYVSSSIKPWSVIDEVGV